MAFQQHREKTASWRMWVRENQQTLTQCGVPEEAYRTELAWFLFLDHGYVQSKSKRMADWWSISWLKPEEARNLRTFLTSEYADLYPHLLWRLDRLADGDTP